MINKHRNNGEAPRMIVEGMDVIIRRDLEKHRRLLQRTEEELIAFRMAKSHEIKKKRYYAGLIGGGKYDDRALRKSMDAMNINIRHMADKAEAATQKMAHHRLIVETLTKQLEQYDVDMRVLREHKNRIADGNAN